MLCIWVEGEVEEMSDEEGEVVIAKEQGGEDVERLKAAKDERVVKEMGDPRRPTQKDVDDHERTHLPYRNWCSVCVRAKGKGAAHRRDVGKERGLSEYSFDYCVPGDELGCKLTVLVGRERVTGTYSATAVPTKGSTGQFAIDKRLATIEEVGDTQQQIILKSDQEPSVVAIAGDVVAEREEGRTVVEESPVGSSGSNGVVERAVQSVEGQIRVILLALEERIGRQLDPEAAIVTFIPEYAAYLLNRLEVGRGGKIAYERVRGKAGTVVGLEFGENVFWRKKRGDKQAKLRSRWSYGVFVGERKRSGELLVVTQGGDVRKVRAVKRLPKEDRWSNDCVGWAKHTPWNKYKDDPDADGDVLEEKVVEAGGAEISTAGAVDEEELIKRKSAQPRAFKINKGDAGKHGYA